MVVLPVNNKQKNFKNRLQLVDNGIHILSIKPLPKGRYQILLQNFSDTDRSLIWERKPKKIKYVDLTGDEVSTDETFSSFEIKTLIVKY